MEVSAVFSKVDCRTALSTVTQNLILIATITVILKKTKVSVI